MFVRMLSLHILIEEKRRGIIVMIPIPVCTAPAGKGRPHQIFIPLAELHSISLMKKFLRRIRGIRVNQFAAQRNILYLGRLYVYVYVILQAVSPESDRNL